MITRVKFQGCYFSVSSSKRNRWMIQFKFKDFKVNGVLALSFFHKDIITPTKVFRNKRLFFSLEVGSRLLFNINLSDRK